MQRYSTLFEKIYEINNCKRTAIALIVLCTSGFALNLIWPHKLFYFNQLLLLFMAVTQIIIYGKIKSGKKKIKENLSTQQESEVESSFIMRTEGFITPTSNNLLSLFFVMFYISTMYWLECLEHSPTGVYGGLLGAITFYIGIQTYIEYVSLLYFVSDLGNLNIKNYSFYIPSYTNWIVQLAHEFNYVEKWFLVLGTLYSLIYAINLPRGCFLFKNEIIINTNCNALFIITWLGIILFFAFAVPVFIYLSHYSIKQCIFNCKCKSIKYVEQQIQETDPEITLKRLAIIKSIEETSDYPTKYNSTVLDKLYTAILSFFTLASPFISIIEQIMFNG